MLHNTLNYNLKISYEKLPNNLIVNSHFKVRKNEDQEK